MSDCNYNTFLSITPFKSLQRIKCKHIFRLFFFFFSSSVPSTAFSYCSYPGRCRLSCENQQHLANYSSYFNTDDPPQSSVSKSLFALHVLRSNGAKPAASPSLRGLEFNLRLELWGFYLRVFFFFFLHVFSLEGSSHSSSPNLLPPTQKTSSLLFAQGGWWGLWGVESSPDVTSNKRKATGIEGGIRPIFNVTLQDLASSWRLSIFLLFCSRKGISCNFPSQGPYLLLRLNSCLLPKKKRDQEKLLLN